MTQLIAGGGALRVRRSASSQSRCAASVRPAASASALAAACRRHAAMDLSFLWDEERGQFAIGRSGVVRHPQDRHGLDGREVLVAELGAVLGAHVGPGMVAVSVAPRGSQAE